MLQRLVAKLSNDTSPPVWPGSAREIVLRLQSDLRIDDVSGDPTTMFGLTLDALRGRTLMDFVRRSDRPLIKALVDNAVAEHDGSAAAPAKLRRQIHLLRAGRKQQVVELALMQDGAGFLALVIDSQHSSPSAPNMTAQRTAKPGASAPATVHDLAAPKNAQDGLIRAAIADLSHELKTPLNAILGFADVMRSKAFGPLGNARYDEYADLIHTSGEHMSALISSALDFAKIEAGKYQLDYINTPIGDVVRECGAMMTRQAEIAGLDLRLDISDALPNSYLDPKALRQMLLNLLSNAIKFTSDGEVFLSAYETNDMLYFGVRDTGVGMNAEELAHLGERFTNVHQQGVRGAPGTGLGLSLVFSLADLHGGDVRLESAPGEGLSVTIAIPVRTAPPKRVPSRFAKVANVQLPQENDIQSQLDRVAAFRKERDSAA